MQAIRFLIPLVVPENHLGNQDFPGLVVAHF